MHKLLYPFLALAFLGFVASVVVHVLALAGLTLPIGDAVWGLHIGIFAVWFPAVIVSIRLGRGAERTGFGLNGLAKWKAMLAGCPGWMRWALFVLFAYAMVNFVVGMATLGSNPRGGGEPSAATLRMFSGHWMIFYAAALAIMVSAVRRPDLLGTPKCSNGHDALPTDNFCPTCGASVQRTSPR